MCTVVMVYVMSVVLMVLGNQPETFASDLGDDQSHYLFYNRAPAILCSTGAMKYCCGIHSCSSVMSAKGKERKSIYIALF